MANAGGENIRHVGKVVSLWRYPVKSMMGEEIPRTVVGKQGLFGDRIYGVMDCMDGKIATAKNPTKWPELFAFYAALCETRNVGTTDFHGPRPPVRVV